MKVISGQFRTGWEVCVTPWMVLIMKKFGCRAATMWYSLRPESIRICMCGLQRRPADRQSNFIAPMVRILTSWEDKIYRDHPKTCYATDIYCARIQDDLAESIPSPCIKIFHSTVQKLFPDLDSRSHISALLSGMNGQNAFDMQGWYHRVLQT